MKIAISPCPNDTYLFHAWVEGLVGKDVPIEVEFADIEQLNTWAREKRYPLIKVSIACLPHLLDSYELLPVGAALGFHCGPKIISKTPFDLALLSRKSIAIPGRDTTAHLLLSKLLPEPRLKVFCPYHEIQDRVARGEVDCGLIIHESRFTFARAGFAEIVDLGELWHAHTGAPLPLGGLVLSRDVPPHTKEKIIAILKQSLDYARAHPEASLPFILEHAQDKEPAIVSSHISTYITSETTSLSPSGLHAINLLLNCHLSPLAV